MNDLIQQWKDLKYCESSVWLSKLREIEFKTAHIPRVDFQKQWRSNAIKKFRELRIAAIFGYGISKLLGYSTFVAINDDEANDCDCIVRFVKQGIENYAPIQIKEVVPSELNDKASLQDVLNKLSKYRNSDLIVVIHINRKVSIDFNKVYIPEDLNVAEVWIFGSVSENQEKWFLYGDLTSKPTLSNFNYPGLDPETSSG